MVHILSVQVKNKLMSSLQDCGPRSGIVRGGVRNEGA